jgi:hypothetical protein
MVIFNSYVKLPEGTRIKAFMMLNLSNPDLVVEK